MRRNQGKFDELIILLSAIGTVVCLYMVSIDHFVRVDLTSEQAFTLSEASIQTMRDLEDPVTVTAYFSSDLAPQFEANRAYLEDLLHEYRAASKGLLSFEFINPEGEETSEDREKKKEVKQDIFGRRVREQTSVEKELEELGIQPVQMQLIEDDKATTKRGYMGLVIRYQEETEVIPVVQSIDSTEYDLTSMIRRLTSARVPVLGLLQGHGELDMAEGMQRLGPLLSQNYEVRPVQLGEGDQAKIPDDVDALLVLGTTEPYSEEHKRAVDQFLMQGKSAAFFLDLMSVDLSSFNPTPVNHGWGDLLSAYGIDLGQDLVADVRCSQLSISERRGFMVVQMPVKYPFIPQLPVLEQTSPLTRGLADIPLAFTMPLFLKEDIDGVKVTSLAQSSDKSWLEPAEASKLDPRRDWGAEDVTLTGPYHLMATAEGRLKSAFGTDGVTAPEGGQGPLSVAAADARVLVVGTSTVAREQFLSQATASLMLNTADWMLLDPAMLKMRNRSLAEPPIDPDLTPATKTFVKGAGILIPVGFLVLVGGIVFVGRSRRRARLMAA